MSQSKILAGFGFQVNLCYTFSSIIYIYVVKKKSCKKDVQILVAHVNMWHNVSTAEEVFAIVVLLKKATFLNQCMVSSCLSI